MAKWYCKIDDFEIGPLSVAELKKVAAKAKNRDQVFVRKEDDAKWRPAKSLKGLFPVKASSESDTTRCPKCRAECPKGKQICPICNTDMASYRKIKRKVRRQLGSDAAVDLTPNKLQLFAVGGVAAIAVSVGAIWLLYSMTDHSGQQENAEIDPELRGEQAFKALKELGGVFTSRKFGTTTLGRGGKILGSNVRETFSLDLRGSRITDEDLKHVKFFNESRPLDQLTLDDAQITDAGLVHLMELHGLSVLSLKGTKVTDEGVKKLSRALEGTKIIR